MNAYQDVWLEAYREYIECMKSSTLNPGIPPTVLKLAIRHADSVVERLASLETTVMPDGLAEGIKSDW